MCLSIDARCMLANILQRTSEADIPVINRYQNNIYKMLKDKCLYIDVARDSVKTAVDQNPHLFMFAQQGRIRKAHGSRKYYSRQYLSSYINDSLPKDVIYAMRTAAV